MNTKRLIVVIQKIRKYTIHGRNFIHVIKYSLSYAFSISYQTSREVTPCKTHPLFNATTKTLVQARKFGWDTNRGVKPVMDLMKDNILECCCTMQLDEEIYDNVFL